MDKLLEDSLRLAADASQAAWKAGYDEGYKAGANWAIAEAQKILRGTLVSLCGNCGANLSNPNSLPHTCVVS